METEGNNSHNSLTVNGLYSVATLDIYVRSWYSLYRTDAGPFQTPNRKCRQTYADEHNGLRHEMRHDQMTKQPAGGEEQRMYSTASSTGPRGVMPLAQSRASLSASILFRRPLQVHHLGVERELDVCGASHGV